MITVRVPLRICLAGGGTDLPAYFREHGGFVLSACINKYLTITIDAGKRHPGAVGITDKGQWFDNRPHPYAIAAGWTDRDRFGLASDVPPGSGLGGSGALMVGLLKARHPDLSAYELAMASYNIERFSLNSACGYQDHVVAAYGGCVAMSIHKDASIKVMREDIPHKLAERLVLFSTRTSHKAEKILSEQACNSSNGNPFLSHIHEIGLEIFDDIQLTGGLYFGKLTEDHWQAKRRSGPTSTSQIDEWHNLGMQNGAQGGKCIGAGAGGYMLFAIDPLERVKFTSVMEAAGLVHSPFYFVDHGAEVIT